MYVRSICHRDCAYTVLQTVQKHGVYSAVYGTVRCKEPLKSFEIRVGNSPGFGLSYVAIIASIMYRERRTAIYIYYVLSMLVWCQDKDVSQQRQNICMTCVQCWTNVEHVGPALHTCYTMFSVCWVRFSDPSIPGQLGYMHSHVWRKIHVQTISHDNY